MVNQELLNYIKSAYESGQSREAITQALLSTGWNKGDVEEGLRATPSEVTRAEPTLNQEPTSRQESAKGSGAQDIGVIKPKATASQSILPLAIIAGTAVIVVGIAATFWILTKNDATSNQLAVDQIVSTEVSPMENSTRKSNVSTTTKSATNAPLDKSTITIDQTTIKSGDTVAFILKLYEDISKYPSRDYWGTFRMECPQGVVVEMQTDYRPGNYSVYSCNDKELPIVAHIPKNFTIPPQGEPLSTIFQLRFISISSGDQIIAIAFRTYNSDGSSTQSKKPITIEDNPDSIIEKTIGWARAKGELYFDEKTSYAGVCSFSAGGIGIRDIKEELETKSRSVVCKDSPNTWAMSVQLSGQSRYSCVDNTGTVIIRNSAITTTSCK